MALPKNTQATVGLDEESRQALRNVSDNVQNAGRNFVTNVKKQARERTGEAVKATGRGATRAASGATFAATQNPFIASGVQKSLESIGKIPDMFKKFTGLFKGNDDSPQQKTNKTLEQVQKNQTSQKGVFTNIFNVLKEIRDALDESLGINRQELNMRKEAEREREAKALLDLEKKREQARKQPRDAQGRFLTAEKLKESMQDSGGGTTFLGALRGIGASIVAGLSAALGVKYWSKAFRGILGTADFALYKLPKAILSGTGKALKTVFSVKAWTSGIRAAIGLGGAAAVAGGGGIAGFAKTIFGGLSKGLKAIFTISAWKGALKALTKGGVGIAGKVLGKIGPFAILSTIFAGVIGGVQGFMQSEKDTLIGKVFDGVKGAVDGMLEWLTWGAIDSDTITKLMEDLKESITGFVTNIIDRVKGIFNGEGGRNLYNDKPGDILTNKETGGKAKITGVENTGPGPSTVVIEKANGETIRVPSNKVEDMFKREQPPKPGSSSTPTSQTNEGKAISDVAKKYGLDERTLRGMALFESDMGKREQDVTSATGLFQVLPKTAKGVIENNPDEFSRVSSDIPNNSMKELLKNPEFNAKIAALLLKDEQKAFQRKFGRMPNMAESQMMHLLGQKKGLKVLANRGVPTSELLSRQAIENNERILKDKTGAQALDTIRGQMSRKLEEDAKKQSMQRQSQNNVIAPSVQQDNRQYSETTNMGPPAKSGSSESTLAKLNQINGMA